MKKIFAIALALVMVLSMASAFATARSADPSSGIGLAPPTTYDCGTAQLFVDEYVRANDRLRL